MRALRLSYAWDQMHTSGVPVKAGLLRLLDLLEERQIPRAVATSTDRAKAEEILRMAGVAKRFSVIIGGDDIANGKPAPDIFLAAALQLGVEPGLCMVLEDSESGTRAAHAAGMIPVVVPDLRELPPEVATLAYGVYGSLDDVAEVLRRLAGAAPDQR